MSTRSVQPGMSFEYIMWIFTRISGLALILLAGVGMTAAFIGLSYPILSGFLYTPEINLNNIFIAHLSGYLGMILSPTHFCLLLTAEHFNADLGKVYRAFLLPLAVLAAVGFALYFLGYPWNLIRP